MSDGLGRQAHPVSRGAPNWVRPMRSSAPHHTASTSVNLLTGLRAAESPLPKLQTDPFAAPRVPTFAHARDHRPMAGQRALRDPVPRDGQPRLHPCDELDAVGRCQVAHEDAAGGCPWERGVLTNPADIIEMTMTTSRICRGARPSSSPRRLRRQGMRSSQPTGMPIHRKMLPTAMSAMSATFAMPVPAWVTAWTPRSCGAERARGRLPSRR